MEVQLRTVLATLGLGFLGATLSSSVGADATPLATSLAAAATPLAASLASGVAGNLATDLFKHFDHKVYERFLTNWSGIDENHHVVATLRLAQIDALRALTMQFEASLGKEDDRLADQAGYGFAERAKTFLSKEAQIAQAHSFSVRSADADVRKAVVALLPDTFDNALVVRRGSNESREPRSAIKQMRSMAETAVLDELRTRCGDTTKRIPGAFEDLFFGTDGVAGWFDLFVSDAADKLTHANSAFAASWNAEQTALIKAYVEAVNIKAAEISTQIDILSVSFTSGMNALAHVRSTVYGIAAYPLRLAAEAALLALRTMPARLQEAINAGASSFSFEEEKETLKNFYAVARASSRNDIVGKILKYQDNYNGYINIINKAIAGRATIEDINTYHSREIVDAFQKQFSDLL